MIGYQKAPLLIGLTPQLVMSESQPSASPDSGGASAHPVPACPGASEASSSQRPCMCEMSGSLPSLLSTQARKSAKDMKL